MSAEHQSVAGGATRTKLPRVGLTIVSALHALPLAWAALVLPWRGGSWFALAVGLLAVGHAALAVLVVSRRERWAAIVWRATALYSLLLVSALTWVTVTSALYLIQLYRGIGQALA